MYWFYRLLAQGLHRLSPQGRLRVAAVLGDLWFFVVRVRRAEIQKNLRIAFPEATEAERRGQARRVMRVLTAHFVETAALLVASDEDLAELIQWEGLEHIQQALEEGGGVLILASHIDNWELLIQGFGLAGLRLNAAVRMPTSQGVNRGLLEIRSRAGFRGHEPRGSIRRLLQVLAEDNEPVTVVMDQAQSRRRGVFVRFFGRPAMTTPGLAILALKSGRPIVPVIPIRVAPGRIRLQAGPPIPLADLQGDPEFVAKATARLTAVVEAHIRRQPDRWLWAHRRFKVAVEEGDVIAPAAEVVLSPDGRISVPDALVAPATPPSAQADPSVSPD